MAVDTLPELKSVFEKWRRERANIRVPIPQALIERAQRAAASHGRAAVREATRIPARRLTSSRAPDAGRAARRVGPPKSRIDAIPAFSRVDLKAPHVAIHPLAEVETPSGVKLRIFGVTSEALALVNALCSKGGAL
jgi:hypothetical protein